MKKLISLLVIGFIIIAINKNTAFATSDKTQSLPKIITTIAPIYSLISSIVGDTAEVKLLIDKKQSPHHFQLKPSQMRMLNKADIIFYINDDFETFLTKPLQNISDTITVISLVNELQDSGVALLKKRQDNDEHHHGNTDYHIWLSTNNAVGIAKIISDELSNKYPQHIELYQNNLAKLVANLQNLKTKITLQLKPYQNIAFLTSHDAYQYFDTEYELHYQASISLNPDIPLSAKRLVAIKQKITENKVKCIFQEPQSNNKIAHRLAKELGVNFATLDPIGVNIPYGKNHYIQLITQMTDNFIGCMSK